MPHYYLRYQNVDSQAHRHSDSTLGRQAQGANAPGRLYGGNKQGAVSSAPK